MGRMWRTAWVMAVIGVGTTAGWSQETAKTTTVAEVRAETSPTTAIATSPSAQWGREPRVGAPVQPVVVQPVFPRSGVENPCSLPDVTSQPSRPEWSSGAQTTQCGVIENDFGWLWQAMGGGATQMILPLSVRYGLTPRMDVRWGLPTRMEQSGSGSPTLTGVTDQWVNVTYRYKEQGARVPAMALSYGFKIPTANPAKGFGSGYVDHQLAWIASRDLRRLHFDFNAVGTLAGVPGGHDGAVQYGLALSFPATKTLGLIVETDGGPQPATPDRFGQALLGVSWAVRPWLVLDTGYTKAYTAGAPRQQFTMGFTYAHRPGRTVMGGSVAFLRALGR